MYISLFAHCQEHIGSTFNNNDSLVKGKSFRETVARKKSCKSGLSYVVLEEGYKNIISISSPVQSDEADGALYRRATDEEQLLDIGLLNLNFDLPNLAVTCILRKIINKVFGNEKFWS